MDLQAQIRTVVADAAQRIAALVAQHIAESVAPLQAMQAAAAAPRAKTPASAAPRAKGEKRSPEAIKALEEKVASFIAKNPGLRIEQINKELGTSTKELALPLRKLVAEKTVRTTGEKRSTKYYPPRAAKKK